jgi:hypothetical protein
MMMMMTKNTKNIYEVITRRISFRQRYPYMSGLQRPTIVGAVAAHAHYQPGRLQRGY